MLLKILYVMNWLKKVMLFRQMMTQKADYVTKIGEIKRNT